ncbi:NIF3-like protein 1 [Sycon ciliatum]|uniref:NIF3-like protein 1 n=1 Tax=Sycon ciliatum TaxID=27933 RepID=UPI0031F6DE95
MQLAEVVTKLNRLAPLRLAAAWDNVGLLLEPSSPQPPIQRMLLTNDFTSAVWKEAESKNVNLIYCYHPVIFAPLKRLTCATEKQGLLVRAVEKRVAIYCPHTAMDAVEDGVNDWLVGGLGDGMTMALETLNGNPREGYGRKMLLNEPVATLDEMIARVKSHLGLKHVQVARCSKTDPIRIVAVCAGSGGKVLESAKADVLVTGEMSHHEILAAVERGSHVITCGHSNTERGFLHTLKPRLEALFEKAIEVEVSEVDADPLVTE